MQNHVRVQSWQEPTDFIFLSGWFTNSKNLGGCITRLRTLVLTGCCSSSIEINYHNKCCIMFFKLYVLCSFSITKLVVLLNWPVAWTNNRKLLERFFLNRRTSTNFGGQVDWIFLLSVDKWFFWLISITEVTIVPLLVIYVYTY